MGKEMAATREQMEKEKRLRDFALMKKEKQAQKLERERLRAEIAKQYSKKISPEQTAVLAPEEGIYLTMRALLKPGDHGGCCTNLAW